MNAIVIAARANGRSLTRQMLIRVLHRGSRRLDQLAAQLAQPALRNAAETDCTAHLEFNRDPHTGHGVLYEDGVRRFTFLQGLERL